MRPALFARALCFLTLLSASLVAISPSIMFSQAGGEWERANNGLWGGEITAIAIADDDGGVIGTKDGIYRAASLDGDLGAISWVRANPVPGITNIQSAADGTLYATNGKVIYRSDDHGASWSYVLSADVGAVAGVDGSAIIYYDNKERLFHYYTLDGSRDDTASFSVSTGASSWVLYNGLDGRVYFRGTGVFGIDRVYVIDPGSLQPRRLEYDTFPKNRTINDIIHLSSDSILTIGPDGLKRTVDGGTTWSIVLDTAFRHVVSRNGVIYAVEDNSGTPLFRSVDFGLTWEICSADWVGLVYRTSRSTITPGGALLTTWDQNLHLLSECDGDWEIVNRGIMSGLIDEIMEAPDGTLYATRYNHADGFEGFYTADLTLYRSVDGGDSWNEVLADINELVGTDAASNVYVRYDSASHFSQGYPTRANAIIYRSTNRGESWNRILRGTGSFAYFFGGAVDPPPVRVVGFKSTSAGIVQINIVGDDDGKAPCSSYISLDSGNTFECWKIELGDDKIRPGWSAWLDEDEVYVLAHRYVGDPGFEVAVGRAGFIYNYISGTAEEVSFPEVKGAYIYTSNSSGAIYGVEATGNRGVRSADRGRTWEEFDLAPEVSTKTWWHTGLRAGRAGELYYTGATDLATNRNRLINARLLGSTDGGESWRALTIPPLGTTTHRIPKAASLPVIASEGLLLDTVHSYGATIPEEFGGGTAYYDAFTWSTDQGASWEVGGGALEGNDVTAFFHTSQGVTFVGTRSAGLFRRTTPLSSTLEGLSIPSTSSISIYPNPVTGATATLQIGASSDEEITAILYNIQGEEVRRLLKGRTSRLSSTVPIDLKGIAPGSYFVRLRRGERWFVIPCVVIGED